jgi:hypothetical protein
MLPNSKRRSSSLFPLPHITTSSTSGKEAPIPEPTIRTYTTLLSIATRTRLPRLVAHALQLMRESSLAQDRLARLAILPFYIRKRKFDLYALSYATSPRRAKTSVWMESRRISGRWGGWGM